MNPFNSSPWKAEPNADRDSEPKSLPPLMDVILGLLGICAVFVIPYIWWGAIKTLAGR